MPSLVAAGRRVHYVYRSRPSSRNAPLLFVHGAGGSHQLWLNQVQALPNAECFAPDLPGHGLSDGPGCDSISGFAALLVAFLDGVGLDRAILVGHSMGGAIALEVALHFPARVEALGLVSTGARLKVAPAILEGLRQDPQIAVRLMCDRAYGPETPPALVAFGRRQMAALPADVLYADFLACDNFDIRERLAAINHATLILCGTEDRVTPPKFSVFLRDHIRGARLHLLDRGGHMLMIEQPQAVSLSLTAFLDQTRPT